MKQLALVCSVLLGCTFGGSDEDPSIEVDGPPETVEPTIDASMMDDDPPPMSVKDASVGVDAALDASPPQKDASVVQSCEPQSPIPTCDPVHNTGCPPLTQCDIDPDATAPSGRCVFWQASLDSNSCASSVLNESCDGQFSCVANACRKVCYCDADCTNGERCSDSAPGPQGAFKLCAP